jgi:hypothetical protein
MVRLVYSRSALLALGELVLRPGLGGEARTAVRMAFCASLVPSVQTRMCEYRRPVSRQLSGE